LYDVQGIGRAAVAALRSGSTAAIVARGGALVAASIGLEAVIVGVAVGYVVYEIDRQHGGTLSAAVNDFLGLCPSGGG
jgi:hypothetical protein